MSNEKILTVSIAGYNIEKYVNTTLSSFIVPEIMEDIEIILVNDGSKDKTSEVGHKFVEMYPDTFIVLDKENGGYGSTINEAVRVAKGKYFKTVDGDDWVDKNGLLKLVKYLKNAKDDIVVTNFARVNDKNKKIFPTVFECSNYNRTLEFNDEYNGQKLFMQALTIKTEILKKSEIKITEHCFYTDIEYILTPAIYYNTITFLNEIVYMYRIAVNEQSMSVEGRKKHIDEQMRIYRKMTAYYKSTREKLGKGQQNFFVTILSEMYKSYIMTILSLSISKEAKDRLFDIEAYTRSIVPDIFSETYKYKTISALRRTNYTTYFAESEAYKLYQKLLKIVGR